MNELQVFKNTEFGEVRTIEENGKVLFCGSDIAKALGYARPNEAVSAHAKGTVKRRTLTAGGEQEMSFITEGDVYRLIAKSHLPAAEQFEKWVFDEVLPTIRKTGGYVNNDDLFISIYLPNADEATTALFKSTLATVRSLNAKIESDKPKVLFADAVAASQTSILVGDLAKIIRQNGVEIGQNRLFDWLRNNGFLIKCGERRNMPTQRSMEMKLFEVKETTINNPDGSIRVTRTTKVTGKGQSYFVNAFLGGKTNG